MNLLLVAAALISSYNCEVSAPQTINVTGETATAVTVGIPAELQRFRFAISLEKGKSVKVRIDWPGDPIQATGETSALTIGKNSYAFSALSGGPCLFTETMCMSQFTLVDQGDNTAQVLIIPTALATDSANDTRKPFIAVLQGRCSRTEIRR